MRKAYSRVVDGRWRTGLFTLLAALCLLCITATATFADTVNIYDSAGVLDQTKVRNEASSLPYPVDIYTTNNFTGSTSSFDQTAKSSLKKSNLIVIAIDTTHRHLAIVGASGVSLSNSQYIDANNAFASNFHNNDYTDATVAAVQSLRGASVNSGGVSVPDLGSSAAGGIGLGTICCIGFLILAAIAVFAVVRGRRRGTGAGFFNRGFNRGPVTPPYDPDYNQYNQGSYPPIYGPSYPLNQGTNPWVMGDLGDTADGLLDYMLDKEQEEREKSEVGKGTFMNFDVFLCHNSIDKPAVKKIAEQLKKRGLLPWLDIWELRPGLPWQRTLEKQIEHIQSAAVFVGKDGIGPWQQMELDAFLRKFVDKGYPVIPVLLDYAPDKPDLPVFLRGMTWVDFRKSDPEPLENLIWGITGKRKSSY